MMASIEGDGVQHGHAFFLLIGALRRKASETCNAHARADERTEMDLCEHLWAEAMRAERQGDAAAYERLLKEIVDLLRRLIRYRLAQLGLSGHETEDLVQEVLIGLHIKRHTWDSRRPFLPWLHAITRYKFIDAARRLRREASYRIDLTFDELAECVEAPAEDVDRHLSGLPQGQQTVVRALAIEGASVRATAEKLRTSEGAARYVSPRIATAHGGSRVRACQTAEKQGMRALTETESLIRKLARQAGTQRDPKAIAFDRTFLVAAALSLAVSVTMVFVLIGVRPDLVAAAQRTPFHYKIASMLSLACGGFYLARRAARPGSAGLPLVALLPGVLPLALRGATDQSALPLMGKSDVSVLTCIGAILLVSMPALFMVLGVLRSGAPTRLWIADAMAGLLSGSLGAAAYSLACVNDGGLFVAIWYTAAILITTGLGAAIGRRTLAW
jgi:RNA polymerase sigma-70 factor, ECF subfamily